MPHAYYYNIKNRWWNQFNGGGLGTIFGLIIGALIMASLDNGMSLMKTNITYQYVIKGVILLLAVWFDIYTRSRSGN